MAGRTPREHPTDRATRWGLGLVASAVALVVLAIAFVLLTHALPAFRFMGPKLVTSSNWDPVAPSFGAWPFVFGTLFSSGLALALAVPIGFLVALFLTELSPTWLRSPLGILVELLAGVPSIVFGMWGLFLLAPKIHERVQPWIVGHWGWIPFFSGHGPGVGFLLAGIVLAIMILPTVTSIARDALTAVPRLEREAAYALGATRWEVAGQSLRSAKAGLFAAATLGLGRALGETVAVYLVIGNHVPNSLGLHLFDQGQTLASTIANEMGEAGSDLEISALIALGLVLFALTLVVNLGARLLIERPWRRRA